MESKGTTVVASCIHQALTDSHRYTTLTDATHHIVFCHSIAHHTGQMIEIHRCLRQICDRTGHGGHRETVNPDSVVGWNLLAVKLDIRLGSLTSGWRREFMTRRYEIPQMVYPCCRDMGNGHRIIRV